MVRKVFCFRSVGCLLFGTRLESPLLLGKEEKERKRDYFTKRVKRLTEIKHNSEGLYRE
jgi:hypothetical protein